MTTAFIVHGHSTVMYEVESYLRSELGVETVVILKDSSHAGETLVEALENRSDVDVVIAIWTADDVGRSKAAKALQPRARQNVIFESGYFMAKMGRARVVVLYEEPIELPSDLHGIVYVPLSSWKDGLRRQVQRVIRPPREILAEKAGLFMYHPLLHSVEDICASGSFSRAIVTQDGAATTGQYDSLGLLFDGNMVVQVKNSRIPCHRQARSYCMWLRLIDLRPTNIRGVFAPQFVFSYGGEEHGRAFGLFHGSPFFEPAMVMEPGLRVFFWCHPQRWSIGGDDDCDSGPFSAVALDRWMHIAITYDGSYVKAYLDGRLVTTLARAHATNPTDLLNIAGFLPGREADYHEYNLRGYIREFMGFRRELPPDEIAEIVSATKHLLGE